MFFLTYIGRELRRRMRQAVFIALGLALGIGLVITVTGASSGVKQAQAKVLRALYGIGTDVTVTTTPKRPSGPPGSSKGGVGIRIGPGGGQICTNGSCKQAQGGTTIDNLVSENHGLLSAATVPKVARLRHVSAAAAGLLLTDNRIVIPSSASNMQPPTSVSVDGTDISHPRLGPLSNATLSSGRTFAAADGNADVALVDYSYAFSHDLKVGDTVTLANTKFKIIGIVTQPEATSPPNVYIPLARAQAVGSDPATSKSLKGEVNTVYVTASSASDIPAVKKEIAGLIPSATVTSSSDLAGEVTGSAASAAKLAGALGRWLAVLVLIAAFAVASLLTMAAVARRVPEFGTLKALGWRSGRIVSQVMGESVSTGIIGGALGVGLGFAGVAIIDKIAPKLSATIPASGGGGLQAQTAGGAGPVTVSPAASHATVAVPMSASVTIGAIVLAVLLAIAGGLLAGLFGGWRAARLRPAAALTKVA